MMNYLLIACTVGMLLIAIFRNVEIDCAYISALASTTAHTRVAHSRLPIPRVMKVKLIPRFSSKTTQPPLVTLQNETTTSNISMLTTTIIPCKNLSLEQPTDKGDNCSKPSPGALKTLLSRDPVDADQCVPSENDSTKIGVITCPCCNRKIEININLNKLLAGISCNATKSRDIENTDYHSSS